MPGLMDKIAAMPKWQTITIAVVLIGALGFAVVYYGFGLNKKEKVEEGYTGSVMLEMSDPDSEEYNKSRYQSYQESDYSTTSSSVSSYWDSLLGEEKADESDVYLDPNIYSPSEILFIQQGIRTKEDIDREHAERALAEANKVTPPPAPVRKALTPEQQDSIYFARLEKAYGIAAKYSGQPEAEPEPEPEPEVRKIDLTGDASKTPEASFLPTDSFTDDGIISSLDTPSQNGLIHYGTHKVQPVKATFLKTEKIMSGQRVIIRLMQDLTLSDGTTIPANTHITGTCTIGRRMMININMLHYGGKMFPTDINVYDNDGTEGIYCPMAEQALAKGKKAKQVAGQAVSGMAGIGMTIFSGGNPIAGQVAGRAASSSIQQISGSLNSDGSVSVEVSAGYEFYVYENVRDNG